MQLLYLFAQSDPDGAGTSITVAISLIAVLVSFASVVVAVWNGAIQRKHSAALEVSTAAFQDNLNQLNEFYGPMESGLAILESQKNAILDCLGEQTFSASAENREDVRLLDIVDKIRENESASRIADRLIATQQRIQEQLLPKSGYVRDPDLKDKLHTLQIHFEGFQVAFEGNKPDDQERFSRFPRGLDQLLHEEAEKLMDAAEKHRSRADQFIDDQWS